MDKSYKLKEWFLKTADEMSELHDEGILDKNRAAMIIVGDEESGQGNMGLIGNFRTIIQSIVHGYDEMKKEDKESLVAILQISAASVSCLDDSVDTMNALLKDAEEYYAKRKKMDRTDLN